MEPRELLLRLRELLRLAPPLESALDGWPDGLDDSREAMQTLEKLHRLGADLSGLMAAALLFKSQKWMFGGSVHEAHVPFEEMRVDDIDSIVASIDKAERHGAVLPAAAMLYRQLKVRLSARADEYRDQGGRFVDAGSRRFALEPAFLVARDVLRRDLTPQPDSSRRRGPRANVDENVLSVLVAAHLRAATGKPRFSLVGQFVAHVLELRAVAGPASDRVRSYEKRARDHWADVSLRPLTEYLAGLVMLEIRLE